VSRLEYALLAALAVIAILALLAGPDLSRRNAEFMPDMVHSPAYASQSSNPVFADGKTAQRPPDGTVARGFMPLHLGGKLLDTTTKWEELSKEQVAAWESLRAPWDFEKLAEPERARIVARGEAVYTSFCIACHGAGGLGDAEVTKRGVPPPPTLLSDDNKALPDGRIYRAITCGKGNMTGYPTQVGREDRWKVLSYVRTLQAR